MNANKPEVAGDARRKVILVRRLRAPRELVYKAWTDPRLIEQWWGPHKWRVPRCELDVRPGGQIRIDMQGPEGIVWPNTGEYREVIPNERLIFTLTTAHDQAGVPRLRSINTLSFEQDGIHTVLTLHAEAESGTNSYKGALESLEIGWQQSLTHLEALVAKHVLS